MSADTSMVPRTTPRERYSLPSKSIRGVRLICPRAVTPGLSTLLHQGVAQAKRGAGRAASE
jgi:hypothetical protein